MKSIILLSLITTAISADKTKSTTFTFNPTPSSTATMNYYTDIDEDAAIYIYFDMTVKNFYKKPTS